MSDKQDLEMLANSERKPPMKIEWAARFPSFLTLAPDAYDQLLALIRWMDDAPICVNLPDRAWESMHDAICNFVEIDEDKWPGVFVDSAQVETVSTMQRNITPGTLVVLLSHEDNESDEPEYHCVLVRGEEKGDDGDPEFNK